jgi:hypothetical protein
MSLDDTSRPYLNRSFDDGIGPDRDIVGQSRIRINHRGPMDPFRDGGRYHPSPPEQAIRADFLSSFFRSDGLEPLLEEFGEVVAMASPILPIAFK